MEEILKILFFAFLVLFIIVKLISFLISILKIFISFIKTNLDKIIATVLIIIGIFLFIYFFPIIITGVFVYLILTAIIPLIIFLVFNFTEKKYQKNNNNEDYFYSDFETESNSNTYQTNKINEDNEYINALKVLNLDETATDREINERYRLLIKLYHPDRLQLFDEKSKKQAEEMLKEIIRAYKYIKEYRKKS